MQLVVLMWVNDADSRDDPIWERSSPERVGYGYSLASTTEVCPKCRLGTCRVARAWETHHPCTSYEFWQAGGTYVFRIGSAGPKARFKAFRFELKGKWVLHTKSSDLIGHQTCRYAGFSVAIGVPWGSGARAQPLLQH
jgi:hypothetical protein